ncbi:MAG: SNF2-related protein [Thermodesulfobacteriota bacterium]
MILLPIFHQILLAHELTLKRPAHDMKKLEAPLSSSLVDLNPHQIDAAVFAFKGPLSKGAILADEVGLGKTIEAGLLISQFWVEGKRKIIVVVPASIRKQWQNELFEKFEIPNVIVDGFEYSASKKKGLVNPFDRDKVVIVSIPFAYRRHSEIKAVKKWDLVVIDEAHRLRNVYKKSGNKQARTLKKLFDRFPKLLLTATPLQNSLLEIYGMLSFIDEKLFGSVYSFKKLFMADEYGLEPVNLRTLKERLSDCVTRTLRRHVKEYIPYTNRLSMTEDFTPTDEELLLYNLVSEYLKREEVIAIPKKQRHLMLLIYRKILASSSFAIAKTLEALIHNLKRKLKGLELESIEHLISDVEGYEEEKEELARGEDGELIERSKTEDGSKAEETFSKEDIEEEIKELLAMKSLAESIYKNAKADALLSVLQRLRDYTRGMGFPGKAVIFTESRRTQEYLFHHLSNNGYRDKITLFNGTNVGPVPKRAYARWEGERIRHEKEGILSKVAAIREALIHEFNHHTEIFLTTEAGAEGINLQFCNVVINYDLPWNPQRVEQRIGRCHRYGQQYDVIVVNFINRKNAADRRVFELLDKKFLLFNGVFGASEEILGTIGSGVDFEMRILEIFQSCRTEEEINAAFDRLQEEVSEKINHRIVETRTKLLEHFDDEVRARFKVVNRKVKEGLSTLDKMLIKLILSCLKPKRYEKKETLCRFWIDPLPQNVSYEIRRQIRKEQLYYIGRNNKEVDGIRLHLNHPLVKGVVKDLTEKMADDLHCIKLCYSKGKHKISLLEPYIGKRGFWTVYKLTFEGLEAEEHLVNIIFVKSSSGWSAFDSELSSKFTTITAEDGTYSSNINPTEIPPDDTIKSTLTKVCENLKNRIEMRNEEYYEKELDKLDSYSEEVLMKLHDDIKKKEDELEIAKRKKQRAMTFEERQDVRKEIHKLEREYSRLVDKVAVEKKRLFKEKDREIKRLEKKLKLKTQVTCIARALWRMV